MGYSEFANYKWFGLYTPKFRSFTNENHRQRSQYIVNNGTSHKICANSARRPYIASDHLQSVYSAIQNIAGIEGDIAVEQFTLRIIVAEI